MALQNRYRWHDHKLSLEAILLRRPERGADTASNRRYLLSVQNPEATKLLMNHDGALSRSIDSDDLRF